MNQKTDIHELYGSSVDNSIWLTIANLGKKISFPEGFIIPYKTYHGLFYILKGKVMLSYFSSKGNEVKALYYVENNIFNEARTFSKMDPPCTFQCIENCNLIFFPKSIFLNNDFIKNNPLIIQNLLSTMGDKILLHYYALTALRANSDIVNLSRFILQLYQNSGCQKCFSISYNQQDIADILGVHRTTVARTIRKLKENGSILSLSHNYIKIGDPKILLKTAEFEMLN